MRILLLLIFLVHQAYSRSPGNPPFYVTERKACGPRCKFRFCGFRQGILIGAPNVVHKVPICKLGIDLIDIVEVGEASITENGSNPVPISRWRPRGLRESFKKRFFRVGDIPGYDNPGVFSKKLKGNQYDILGGTCVVLPIKKYTIARLDGSPKTRTSRGASDCLSFSVRTAEIIIELEWFSGDDLDLSVREPDGTIVNFRKLRSKCGFLMQDNCVDCCGIFGSSRERIIYRTSCARFQRGGYRAIVRHASNCGLGATKWVLRVIVNGVVTRKRTGESDKDGGQFAGRLKFSM